jgi:hypothetical protein
MHIIAVYVLCCIAVCGNQRYAPNDVSSYTKEHANTVIRVPSRIYIESS